MVEGVPAGVEAGEVDEDARAGVGAVDEPRGPEALVDVAVALARLPARREQLTVCQRESVAHGGGPGRRDLLKEALLEVALILGVLPLARELRNHERAECSRENRDHERLAEKPAHPRQELLHVHPSLGRRSDGQHRRSG